MYLVAPASTAATTMRLACVFVLALLFVLCASDRPDLSDRARLVVTKEVLNRYLVEAKEVTLLYTIHNLSPKTARDVEIHDRLPESDFTFVHGSRSTRWPSVLPMSNITHSVIVIPRSAGYFNFASAEVTYKAGMDGTVTYGYSSAPGMRLILIPSVFNRQFSSHWVEWICFAFIMTPCLAIPYMLWRASASKYK
uniref:Translocon-associated protein subunit beta n=1 Tax=Echinococcus canadensis TaxID=519352 RepID=A0A915EV19_9CEST